MKDFPIFTTQFGTASLTLKQIPYRGEAYIHVQDSLPDALKSLIAECAHFCRLAGAEKVYVTAPQGQGDVRILEMRGVPALDPDQIENIFPVTEQTVEKWRKIANERLRNVDLAGLLSKKDEEKILCSGGAYFIHRAGTLLGIGWLQEDTLKLLASVVPGAGYRVAQTILSVNPGQSVRLEVASTNHRAIALYEKLGFLPVRELEAWREVSKEEEAEFLQEG